MVQAVPAAVAAALSRKTYYFVPLAMAEGRGGEPAGQRSGNEATMVSPVYTSELADLAICHRNVALENGTGGSQDKGEGVFISTRLLSDRFSLAFEFFINVGHAFVDEAGVAESFAELAWNQAVADVRGRDQPGRVGEPGSGAGERRELRAAMASRGSMRRPRRIIWRRRSRMRSRSTCCRSRWILTTPSCASASIRCWLRRRWRNG